LCSAGKSTLAEAVFRRLRAAGKAAEWLDGDLLRHWLGRDLEFSREDREENVRRIGFVAALLAHHGVTVLVAAIAPYRETRAEVRRLACRFIEVYVNAPLDVCQLRDVKGLYRRARAGELPHLTGVDDPYEPPLAADVECRTAEETVDEGVEKILATLRRGAV